VSERPFNGTSFRAYLNEHKLMGSQCTACGALHVPPRPLCPACHGQEMTWQPLSGQGKLVAFTTIHIAPTAMLQAGYGRQNPYCTGIVQLEEGPRISAQILDLDATHPLHTWIGTPLQADFIERGEEQERQIYLAFRKPG